ncbi:hypothetical protein C0J52_22271 [Blattella germanica]|nr:hypothetical protein C0J52_22271 [Blattella germanica]
MESKRPFSFNVEELQELILNPCSSVRAKRSIRHIAIHPSNLGDLKAAIKKILNQLLNKIDSNFGGFLLGYKNVIVTTSKGVVVNDDYSVHFDIEADFYIFTPEVGCILNGFMLAEYEEWLGESVGIGDRVTFSVKLCDFTGNLPYLQGTLMSSSPASKENAEVQSPKKKKHKKDSSIENSQDEILVVPEVEVSNKRKRDSDDDVDGTRKKKKNRRKREEAEEDNTEQFNSLHMSSENPEYGRVIQHIKTAYLNENVEEENPKKEKDKKKHKKRKLHTTLNESVEITNEVDAAEQVQSKKKNQTEKHESEETTSVVPKYNQLWENFQGRSKKLEESLASWNTSSLGFEQVRKSLQTQKDTVKEKDKKKHKKRKLHTTLNESVEIKNEVDAAEQVASKKKKKHKKDSSTENSQDEILRRLRRKRKKEKKGNKKNKKELIDLKKLSDDLLQKFLTTSTIIT